MQTEFMKNALEIAKQSDKDIPVGAVIVKDGKIISHACNEREKLSKTTAHAEIIAIEKANETLKNWRLNDCEMYVTLEPCPMCASAIIQARIKKVYFGAYDSVNGAFGSKCDMRNIMNIFPEVKGGIMEEACSELLKNGFERIRNA